MGTSAGAAAGKSTESSRATVSSFAAVQRLGVTSQAQHELPWIVLGGIVALLVLIARDWIR